MKVHQALLFIGLVLSSCSNGQEKSIHSNSNSIDSVKVKNKIPEFEIAFPKTAYEVTKKTSDPANTPVVTNWLLEGKDENGPFMYFVAHNKLIKDLENLIAQDASQLDIAFQGMLYGSAEKLGGFEFEYTKTDYKGHSGMASKCKVFNGEGIIKSVVYLIDKDVFMISAGGRGINEEAVDSFLSSFKLTK